MELVFVTNNPNKLNEIQSLVSNDISIKSLKDIDFHDEIDETEITLEGNALLKARHIHSKFGLDCFADDTGLEIEALNGAPGVFSARYAGKECNLGGTCYRGHSAQVQMKKRRRPGEAFEQAAVRI